jgi:hypothetical protein
MSHHMLIEAEQPWELEAQCKSQVQHNYVNWTLYLELCPLKYMSNVKYVVLKV